MLGHGGRVLRTDKAKRQERIIDRMNDHWLLLLRNRMIKKYGSPGAIPFKTVRLCPMTDITPRDRHNRTGQEYIAFLDSEKDD
jgi:hypothetical protein